MGRGVDDIIASAVLSFDRPLGVVADLVLHRDHADPTLVHYLPARPRIVHAAEGPALSLVKLRGVDLVDELRVREDDD